MNTDEMHGLAWVVFRATFTANIKESFKSIAEYSIAYAALIGISESRLAASTKAPTDISKHSFSDLAWCSFVHFAIHLNSAQQASIDGEFKISLNKQLLIQRPKDAKKFFQFWIYNIQNRIENGVLITLLETHHCIDKICFKKRSKKPATSTHDTQKHLHFRMYRSVIIIRFIRYLLFKYNLRTGGFNFEVQFYFKRLKGVLGT